jgi:thioredoxin-dependent peroxiredoxin
VALLGCSFDPPGTNRAFAEKHDYRGRLLSDVDRSVGERYETKRSPEERSPDQAKRRTYLIDPDGVIRRAYRVSDIVAHPLDVLEDLRTLGAIA